jgi:hypothetical protein
VIDMVKRVKAKDLQAGDKIFIRQSLYRVVGKQSKGGKVVMTAKTVGKTSRTDTIKYAPDTYIHVP